ncbi:AraC family transcriptional regulator [Chitinophaga qingshengii]|uniref:AraC family transcriptional regulator n=1 Tax=Chitinophaga qingshengii TaxID=1569794 RepID=A0ABR7TG90_9BACT|nr:helix-turn-helix domain-containing protein [Chitinophaga qingshengii]MBC9928935.1 AraC family transcriptional regulator [Chitinophaga qingshengii]
MLLDWRIVYTGGVFISLFLFIILISKRQKSTADKILTAWFFFAVIHQLLIGWYAFNGMSDMPVLIGWELPFPFLHGPFLYLYILFLTGQQRRESHDILHFLPALLSAIILAPVLPSMSVQEKLGASPSAYAPLFEWMVRGIIVSGLVYVILSLVLLYRHRLNVALQFSNTDKITLNWLRYLIGGMGAIWIVVIFLPSASSLYVVVTLFIFFIGYFGIRQVGIFSNPPPAHEVYLPAVVQPVETAPALETVVVSPEKVKYEKSGLTDTEANRIHTSLTTLMQERQCYKDAGLTLGDLAKTLDIHPAILSQVINSKEGKSFYDYINVLRVEAFKQLLLQPVSQRYTLLSLAFECGFNSKTSFNRNFKKITRLSPSSYLKEMNICIQEED